jgi:hypothetical protein
MEIAAKNANADGVVQEGEIATITPFIESQSNKHEGGRNRY